MTSPPPDYTTYTRTDLLTRISHLESLLPTPSNPSRPPKKPPKPFDPSRYNTRLIALKFAYLGGAYNGFEHHLNNTTPLPTIEEELWKALRKTRLIFNERVGDWEGCEYSKCGRTDRGVSAFGQVVGVRVRSARPKGEGEGGEGWDSVRDEMPYLQILNRVLPADIRVLAWCPDPGVGFSARFNCKERRYRYFFTNPATVGVGGLMDVEKMRVAARKYAGLHDFRNLCKIDPSKQITNWQRRVFHADIHEVSPPEGSSTSIAKPRLYYFEVRGSAFLWHQVRHLVAILFLVGQGYEEPSIVDELLDVERTPNRPHYHMASDAPLVLWDCIFPEPEKVVSTDHGITPDGQTFTGYEDSLPWIYIGDENGGRDLSKQVIPGVDGKWGRNGIMDELWALWRKRKMDEVLAGSLMELVGNMGGTPFAPSNTTPRVDSEESDRVFDGSERATTVGPYIPLMQRARMDAPDVVNARYATRKGLDVSKSGNGYDVVHE